MHQHAPVANRATIERVAPEGFGPLIRYLQTANAGGGYTTKHYAISARKARLGAMGSS
jgi:cyclopropane-fatty-acyl-phospholipid synthase